MFTKLSIAILLAFSAYVHAETSAPIFFEDVGSIDSWFSIKYQKYENVKDEQYPETLIYYGVKGSGINRVDGWFFSCAKAGRTCSLIFMANFGESRYFKPAKIAMNKNNLIIRTSDVEIAFKITK